MATDWSSVRSELGTVPDTVIARRFGVSRERVRQIRHRFRIAAYQNHNRDWTKIDPLLGKEFDEQLASRFGIPLERVSVRRRTLGILAKPRASQRKNASPLWNFMDILGTMPDYEVGELTGLTQETVCRFRNCHKIPSFRPRTR